MIIAEDEMADDGSVPVRIRYAGKLKSTGYVSTNNSAFSSPFYAEDAIIHRRKRTLLLPVKAEDRSSFHERDVRSI